MKPTRPPGGRRTRKQRLGAIRTFRGTASSSAETRDSAGKRNTCWRGSVRRTPSRMRHAGPRCRKPGSMTCSALPCFPTRSASVSRTRSSTCSCSPPLKHRRAGTVRWRQPPLRRHRPPRPRYAHRPSPPSQAAARGGAPRRHAPHPPSRRVPGTPERHVRPVTPGPLTPRVDPGVQERAATTTILQQSPVPHRRREVAASPDCLWCSRSAVAPCQGVSARHEVSQRAVHA